MTLLNLTIRRGFKTTSCSLAKIVMRAVRIQKFGAPQVLQVENIPIPTPGANEVLIEVKAAGINPVDTYIREGAYAILPELPAIIGKDAAGIVSSVGSDVKNIKAGDRVFCGMSKQGTYAEYALCGQETVFALPEKLTFSQGAALYVPYFTAYRALVTKCHVKAGEILLVHGASGAVGIAAVQLGKLFGLKVIGTAGTQEGMDLVKSLGADDVFNHREKGYLNNAVAATGGHGFDVILENLANVNLGKDLNVLSQNARVVVVGNRGSVEINPRSLMMTESSIIGVALMCDKPEEIKEAGKCILKGIEDGVINPVIAHEYTLEEAAQAHHDIINTKGAKGKLVFRI